MWNAVYFTHGWALQKLNRYSLWSAFCAVTFWLLDIARTKIEEEKRRFIDWLYRILARLFYTMDKGNSGWLKSGGSVLLNVYTGQNPRQRVVIKNTSQMRTTCTQFGRNLSVYLSLHASFSPGGGIFLQIRFSLVKCPSIITFILLKICLQYSWISNLQK